MYPLLTFSLPAAQGLDRNAVNALMINMPASTNYNYLPPTKSDGRISRADMGEKTQMRFEGDVLIEGKMYSAAWMEQFDHDHNLLWQTRCAYVTAPDKEGPGWFCFSLARRPLEVGSPVYLGDVRVFAPKIVTTLVEESFANSEAVIGNFPEVWIGAKCELLHPGLTRKLKRRLTPFARVCDADTDFRLESPVPARDDTVEIRYPGAGICRQYLIASADAECPENIKPADLECIVLDTMRMVSEYHGDGDIPWDRIFAKDRRENETATGQDSYYCYMNDDMRALLRQARKSKGLSQETLGKRVNTTGLVISRLERGEVMRVLRTLLEGIEGELGLPAGAIASLQGTAEKKQKPASENAGKASTLDQAEERSASAEDLPHKAGFCRNCGEQLYSDCNFCPKCGKKAKPY